MPSVPDSTSFNIGKELLMAAGAPEGHATTVARHLTDANLAGHDSHGFIRLIQYIREIREGITIPDAEPEVYGDKGGVARVNGHRTFGQVVATFALETGMKKARDNGVSMVTMHNLGHTGRVGTYPERAAKEGFAAIMCTGIVGGRTAGVAPFGGSVGRLATNPISMSFPYKPDLPILSDFATSMAAEGKLRVYRARGHELPDEWVLDKDGNPSRNPNDYYDGGAILPLGGIQGGHKGYALSVMVALFGAIMAELGTEEQESTAPKNSSMIILIDVSALAPIDTTYGLVQDMIDYVKDTPPMEGSKGVLYPGEIEAMTRVDRLANGISIEDATWDEVMGLVRDYGVKDKVGPLPS